MEEFQKKSLCWMYSHLSNKREVTLTDFEKFHPPQKKSPLEGPPQNRFFLNYTKTV
jgi:hypothetical protein